MTATINIHQVTKIKKAKVKEMSSGGFYIDLEVTHDSFEKGEHRIEIALYSATKEALDILPQSD